MFVKPAPGLYVLDPATKRPLPPEGKEVAPKSYWLRRLAAGDVVAPAPDPVIDNIQIPDSVKVEEEQ